MTPWLCIKAAVSGEGEVTIACAPSTSVTSAVMATLLPPSAATWSFTFVATEPIAAARSSLPLSQRSTSATAWVMTSLGMANLLRGPSEGLGEDADPTECAQVCVFGLGQEKGHAFAHPDRRRPTRLVRSDGAA